MKRLLNSLLLSLPILLVQIAPSFSQSPFWQRTSLDSGTVNVLATNAQGDIFAFTGPDGLHQDSFRLYRSTNDGDDWDILTMGFNSYVYCLLTVSQNDLFAVVGSLLPGDTTNGGIYYSSDKGNTWEQRLLSYRVRALITPDSGRTFLASKHGSLEGGVYRSNDSCRTFTRLTPNTCPDYQSITQLAITKQGSILGAVNVNECGPSGITRSTDEGKTWMRYPAPPADASVPNFLITPEGDIFQTTEIGVYRSSDDGMSWTLSLPWFYMMSIVMDSNRTIYAGTRWSGSTIGHSLYCSTDNGVTWTAGDSGLTYKGVNALVINCRGYIFAGCYGGVFRSISPITDVDEKKKTLPTLFSLNQNYPNPFNPVTMLSYTVAHSSFVTLKIYDLLGQEVATLVNEEKQPGSYSVEWSALEYPSGVYFYRIVAGTFSETKKLLLLR